MMSELLGQYASKDENLLCLVWPELIAKHEAQVPSVFDSPWVSSILED